MFNTLGILSILAASSLSGLIKVKGNQGHHNRVSIYAHAKIIFQMTDKDIPIYIYS
jgi:hypothetical protein